MAIQKNHMVTLFAVLLRRKNTLSAIFFICIYTLSVSTVVSCFVQ